MKALKNIRAIGSAEGARFAAASRTDRGVNALGNVMAFDTPFDMSELLGALNAVSPSVFYYAMARVPPEFNVRRARERWYRYLLPTRGVDFQEVKETASVFEGTHDFRHFCKADERKTVRTLREVTAFPVGKFIVIDFRARDFLWNMVRRMVAAMEMVGKRKATVEKVESSLEGDGPPSFGLAPPERLTLMDVEYKFDFTHRCPPTLKERAVEAEEGALSRLFFYRALFDLCNHSED